MSSIAAVAGGRVISIKRARVLGIVFLAIGLAGAWWFGAGSEPGLESTLGLNAPDTSFDVPDLVLPSRATAFLLSVVCLGADPTCPAAGVARSKAACSGA